VGAYGNGVALRPGLSGRASLVVSDADTAAALRSGDVPVLGTPRLVALCEEAACLAVTEQLGEGQTTVGNGVQFQHLAPTAVGRQVTAEATLEKVEGRRLSFTVSANDPGGLVGAGKMTRVIVGRRQFLERAAQGAQGAPQPKLDERG
jgi:fluoroacetyl-CoA thioesterase